MVAIASHPTSCSQWWLSANQIEELRPSISTPAVTPSHYPPQHPSRSHTSTQPVTPSHYPLANQIDPFTRPVDYPACNPAVLENSAETCSQMQPSIWTWSPVSQRIRSRLWVRSIQTYSAQRSPKHLNDSIVLGSYLLPLLLSSQSRSRRSEIWRLVSSTSDVRPSPTWWTNQMSKRWNTMLLRGRIASTYSCYGASETGVRVAGM